VGLSYHSAHEFRHGHVVYAIKNSKDVGDLKAVSMKLMHSNLSITDGVYGILSSRDVGNRIAGLGNKVKTGFLSQDDLIMQLTSLINLIKGA
jgi:integrase